MPMRFIAMPTTLARRYQAGGLDAYGLPPEPGRAEGAGLPCRHCLQDIAAGAPCLLLAYRPFAHHHAYAETGPVFLHAAPCKPHAVSRELPPILAARQQVLLRGYGADERLAEGTGQMVACAALADVAAALFARPDIACLHLRSAGNGGFLCRIERG